jgi:diguanylate cyclase (GGDEF)-like protein
MYGLSREIVRPGCLFIDILRCRAEVGDFLRHAPEDYRTGHLAAMAENKVTTLILEGAEGREVLVTTSPMAAGGWVATHEDITERRKAEAKIEYMAHHDALTDLANRLQLFEQLEETLARPKQGAHLAVFCLDLDRFKDVNDEHGHPIGDLLLRTVAKRLRQCIRDSDLVARLGGDEFAIMQVGASQSRDATALASRLIEVIGAPYELGGRLVVIEASVGIALAPNDGLDPDQLLKNADTALYRAKSEGRGLYRFFEPEMDARMQARRTLEIDLRKALANGEFELFYQPLVDMQTEYVTGFEALIRWHHPERGLIVPLDFIPVAEETGLIVPIGDWVLRQACAEAATWPSNVKVAVNLSPIQFKKKGILPAVVSALAASGLSPDRLELEITESVLLQDGDATLAVLQELRALGARISMDDFGTGYSSLSYLRKFPFDKIKIDQSFIFDMSDHSDGLAIVRAVIAMGSGLGIATTAEGVETLAQFKQLKLEGCTEVQGYLFSPPRPAAEIKGLLASINPKLRAIA